MKYRFVSLENGAKPTRNTFKEAFADMYHWIKSQKKLYPQILNTHIWIEWIDNDNCKGAIYFPSARDRAIDDGILKDGKLT